jgi:hypothetical protein
MLGVEVSSIELRVDLPEVVKDDIDSDFTGDDDTPRVDSPRVKTIKMPPIAVDHEDPESPPPPPHTPMKILKTKSPTFGPATPHEEPTGDQPTAPRTTTRHRSAMPALHRPTVEVTIEDLDDDAPKLSPSPSNQDDQDDDSE